ncbi:MAG: hypothetical protein CFH43_00085 [Proteobacteria bacterium]|nr:MAG: hypothetical protein CFH43_00085 [Pseudomonadota bacterium]
MSQLNSIDKGLEVFDNLPESAFVRLPVVMGLFSCSAPTVWRRVAEEVIPRPKKLSGITLWNVGELRKTLSSLEG